MGGLRKTVPYIVVLRLGCTVLKESAPNTTSGALCRRDFNSLVVAADHVPNSEAKTVVAGLAISAGDVLRENI